jgi:hypothetical protein
VSITAMRALVAGLLGDAPVPVHQWLPGNTDDLPALVVGRPNVAEGDQAAIIATTVPVFALGRRSGDDDAQQELDRLADLLLARFWQPPRTEGVGMRLQSITAGVIEVAGLDIPAYTASLLCTSTYCS